MIPSERRRILAWCVFVFANSAYSAVIVVTVFSVYYVSYIVGNERGLGDLWWGRAISTSLLLGSQRAAVAAVGVFSVAGLILLQRVRPALPAS